MFTLYNLCSVNWGIFSTSGDVQYMGGYHEYIGACSVHQGISLWMWEDTMCTRGMFSTSEKYHQYMGGGGGDIMSTLGDVQHIRWISWCIWGSNLINPFNFYWKPQCTHDIPWCTEHPSMYSWYPPHASWYPPMYWTSPNVFMISHSLMHSWYPPMYLTPPIYSWDSPVYWTPPMYWTTHYTGWFYVCIKSTNGNILVFFLFNCEFMHF